MTELKILIRHLDGRRMNVSCASDSRTVGRVSPTTGCFSCRWSLLDATKSAPKKLNKTFFQYKLYSLKARAHYFTVLIYLETWSAAKLGIFTNFTFRNLPSQSINSLMYIYYTDPQLLFMSAWPQSNFFVIPPKKFQLPQKFLYYLLQRSDNLLMLPKSFCVQQ